MKCAWNRRSRQRKYINRLFKLFDFLFVLNAEAVFLVNDQKPKVVKFDRFGEETVRPNNDIHRPVRQSLFNLLYLLRCPKPV